MRSSLRASALLAALIVVAAYASNANRSLALSSPSNAQGRRFGTVDCDEEMRRAKQLDGEVQKALPVVSTGLSLLGLTLRVVAVAVSPVFSAAGLIINLANSIWRAAGSQCRPANRRGIEEFRRKFDDMKKEYSVELKRSTELLRTEIQKGFLDSKLHTTWALYERDVPIPLKSLEENIENYLDVSVDTRSSEIELSRACNAHPPHEILAMITAVVPERIDFAAVDSAVSIPPLSSDMITPLLQTYKDNVLKFESLANVFLRDTIRALTAIGFCQKLSGADPTLLRKRERQALEKAEHIAKGLQSAGEYFKRRVTVKPSEPVKEHLARLTAAWSSGRVIDWQAVRRERERFLPWYRSRVTCGPRLRTRQGRTIPMNSSVLFWLLGPDNVISKVDGGCALFVDVHMPASGYFEPRKTFDELRRKGVPANIVRDIAQLYSETASTHAASTNAGGFAMAMQRLDERNGFPIAKALDKRYGDFALGYMLTIRDQDRPEGKTVLESDAATFATGGIASIPRTTKILELYVLF